MIIFMRGEGFIPSRMKKRLAFQYLPVSALWFVVEAAGDAGYGGGAGAGLGADFAVG